LSTEIKSKTAKYNSVNP